MSETTGQPGTASAGPTPPPGAAPGATRPRLERPRQGRTFVGVCAALGRYTDVDPVIYRVILVVLAIFGGLGLALYAIGWLLIPEEGEPTSKLERIAHRHARRWRTPAGAAIAIGALIFLAVLTATSTRNTTVTVLLLALIAYLLLRRPHAGGGRTPVTEGPPAPTWWSAEYAAPATGSAAAAGATTIQPTTEIPAPGQATAPAPMWTPPPTAPWQPSPPRPRSQLGILTLSTSLVVVGLLVALRQVGVDGLTASRILAAGLAVIALGLVAGGWVGRARWLVVPGALLAVVTVTLTSLGVPLSGGAGQRAWTPTSAADVHPSYHLAFGTATLDLRRLSGTAGLTTVTATVGMGRLYVFVPRDATVDVTARSGAGVVLVFGQRDDGVSSEKHVVRAARAGGPVIDLVARVGFGGVEVDRAAA